MAVLLTRFTTYFHYLAAYLLNLSVDMRCISSSLATYTSGEFSLCDFHDHYTVTYNTHFCTLHWPETQYLYTHSLRVATRRRFPTQ